MANKIENQADLSNAVLDKMADDFGKVLNAMPKIKIKIPFDKLNPKDEVVPVCINGYNFFIQRGKAVDVPEQVAVVLEEAGYI